MSTRKAFATISPLPAGISREAVVGFLHNHIEMIDLNPLVKERRRIRNPPPHAPPDELHCAWYALTDRISYLPGGLANGDVTYTCAFHNLPNGVETHCYAPAGLNIRERWTVEGSVGGGPAGSAERKTGGLQGGLYIREDVDVSCNVLMATSIKSTLKKSHATLVQRLQARAQMTAFLSNDVRQERKARQAVPPAVPHISDATPEYRQQANYRQQAEYRQQVPRKQAPMRPFLPGTSRPPGHSSDAPLTLQPGGVPSREAASKAFRPYRPQSYAPPGASSVAGPQHTTSPYTHVRGAPSESHLASSLAPSHQQVRPHSYVGPASSSASVPYEPRQRPDPRIQPPWVNPTHMTHQDTMGSAYAADDAPVPVPQQLRPRPSHKYKVAHPEYPQMNPYAQD